MSTTKLWSICVLCFVLFATALAVPLWLISHDCSPLIEYESIKVISVGAPVESSGIGSGPSYSVVYLEDGRVFQIPRSEIHMYRIGGVYNMRLVQERYSGLWTPDRFGECGCFLTEVY